MKKYKIIKLNPFFQIGFELWYDDITHGYYIYKDGAINITGRLLDAGPISQDIIDKFPDFFEEIKEEEDIMGEIEKNVEKNFRVNWNNNIVIAHNCLSYIPKLKAFIILSELAEKLNDGWGPDWNDKKEDKCFVYFGYYKINEFEREYKFSVAISDVNNFSNIYFKSEKLAEQAIKLGEKYWYDLFGINIDNQN